MQALSHDNKNFNILEPFRGLFTQGMVCHDTYKDPDNNWISPDEIENINGKKYLKKDKSKLVSVGPSESMSKSKRNVENLQEYTASISSSKKLSLNSKLQGYCLITCHTLSKNWRKMGDRWSSL